MNFMFSSTDFSFYVQIYHYLITWICFYTRYHVYDNRLENNGRFPFFSSHHSSTGRDKVDLLTSKVELS